MPIIFGIILDEACIVWQKSCDRLGACWIYDSHKMAFLVFILSMVVKIISTGCFLIAAAVYKPRPTKEMKTNLSDVDVDLDITYTDAQQMEKKCIT